MTYIEKFGQGELVVSKRVYVDKSAITQMEICKNNRI